MSKHTSDLTIKMSTEVEPDWAILDKSGFIIGEAFWNVGRNVYRPAEENARLWSKAPQLLNALKEVTDCLSDIAAGRGGWAWEEVIQDAHTLLAELDDGNESN